MYLKNLTMQGFKSFADRTSLDFQDGVTAIVGPNGCGKSNVADAIRWVLGEQSAKALRGGAMQDVIFSGTDRRRQLQMAEVSMTLDDVTENQLQAAGLDLSYSEVRITRRVYRDGGSEYEINGLRVRLRDIQQLFMGTGVGRTSYSIMAQGNITQILSSKPDDRRLIFEEAAGITRYKAQKREALRKLEHTEQNLVRVEDLIGEVKRRIGTLQRQAGKARKYKEIMDCLKTLDTQLSRHKLDVHEADRTRLEQETRDLHQLRGVREEEYSAMESQVEVLREEQSTVDALVSESQQQLTSLRAEKDQNFERISFHEQRVLELEEQRQQAANESVEADERLKAARSELERATRGLEETESGLESQRVNLQRKNEAMLEVERVVTGLQDQVNQFQSRAYSTAQELAQLSNQINRFDLEKQGDLARLEKLHTEKQQIREELARLEENLSTSSQTLEDSRRQLSEFNEQIGSIQSELGDIRAQAAAAQTDLQQIHRSQTEKESRLQVLQQLEQDQEGLEPGTQKVLQQFEGAVNGLLIDHIRVADEFVPVVEALLKDRFELILCRSHQLAEEIATFLRESEAGRVQLGILDHGSVPTPAHPDGLTPVAALIECEDWLRPLITRLAGNYYLTDSIGEALSKRQDSVGYVTRAGEVVHPQGVAVAGGKKSQGGQGATSALSRKNLIESLGQEISALNDRAAGIEQKKSELDQRISGFEAELQERRDIQRTTELEIAGIEASHRSATAALDSLTQKLEVADFEIERLEGSQNAGSEKRLELDRKKSDLENQGESIRQEMSRINGELESIRQKRDNASAELTEAKVAVASNEQMIRGYQNQITPLRQRITELEALLAQRGRDQEAFAHRRQQSLEAIENARSAIGDLDIRIEEQTVELSTHQQQKAEVLERIRLEEVKLREFRGKINEIQNSLTRFEVEIAQKTMHIESLIERVHERYQIDLREVPGECITITIADNGPPEIHKMTPDEMEESGASTDWDLIEEQVRDLQGTIDSMGPVNLVAIEEYEETEQRYEFLNGQHQDLTEAREKLLDAINRINTETREMFLATFHQIRTNFQSTFEEIFGGGTADLTLVDEEDVLETGIDIVARPPGKKLQSISLLSGGEQTMTAVALLFAIYQVKPSPFCVLDELDAPLDESNINRFLKILKRFVGQSQFLIITHNKRTISMADTLYGVTMQERGVSKIISVRFKDRQNGSGPDEKEIDDVIQGALT